VDGGEEFGGLGSYLTSMDVQGIVSLFILYQRHFDIYLPKLEITMETFRHNLSPGEVKIFLKTVAALTENLFIYYCFKVEANCPKCGQPGFCRAGAVSLFSSRFDKVTHEISTCLLCRYKELTTVLTCEKL